MRAGSSAVVRIRPARRGRTWCTRVAICCTTCVRTRATSSTPLAVSWRRSHATASATPARPHEGRRAERSADVRGTVVPRKGVAALAAALLLVLLLPEPAWAFGPATHVFLGSTLLDALHLLPPALAELLRAHPQSFLYGSMAADISFAKKY